MDLQQAKERTENDFKYSLQWYKVFVDELSAINRQLLDLKIGFGGFIAVVFTVVFSNTSSLESFSNLTKYGLLVIMSSVILLFVEEIWKAGGERAKNLSDQKRNVMLLKIRHYATKDPQRYKDYGTEAEKRYFEEDLLFKEMKENKSFDEIIKAHKVEVRYKLHLILWSALPLTLLLLFLFEIYAN